MREIPDEKIKQVELLLHEGHGQREVARRTGVSRSTVNRVATRRRAGYARTQQRPEEEFLERCGPIGRCQGCGHLVEMPCLICKARAVREQTLRKRRIMLAEDKVVRPLHASSKITCARREVIRRKNGEGTSC